MHKITNINIDWDEGKQECNNVYSDKMCHLGEFNLLDI